MILRAAISLVTLMFVFNDPLVPAEAAEITGEWAGYQEDCSKGAGNADTVTITKSKISGMEWECKVLKRSKKGANTVASVNCTDGLSWQKGSVSYRVDSGGTLHVNWGNGSSDSYQYQCR
jgi:hypothetical protein